MSSACNGGEPASGAGIDVPQHRMASDEAQARGGAIYQQHCALCHGVAGDGRGVRRSALSSKPTDFRSPAWQKQASAARMFAVLRDGIPGSSMPAWVALSEDERWDVIAYVMSLDGDGRR